MASTTPVMVALANQGFYSYTDPKYLSKPISYERELKANGKATEKTVTDAAEGHATQPESVYFLPANLLEDPKYVEQSKSATYAKKPSGPYRPPMMRLRETVPVTSAFKSLQRKEQRTGLARADDNAPRFDSGAEVHHVKYHESNGSQNWRSGGDDSKHWWANEMNGLKPGAIVPWSFPNPDLRSTQWSRPFAFSGMKEAENMAGLNPSVFDKPQARSSAIIDSRHEREVEVVSNVGSGVASEVSEHVRRMIEGIAGLTVDEGSMNRPRLTVTREVYQAYEEER